MELLLRYDHNHQLVSAELDARPVKVTTERHNTEGWPSLAENVWLRIEEEKPV